jgi:hypothetical protein
MYFLVLRHLSGINKSVQTSHTIAEYAFKYHDNQDFRDYIINDKTIIMLDGGTHQEMVEAQRILTENNINHAYFTEPDVNDAMTAICFLVDERIWDRTNYHTFTSFTKEKIENNSFFYEESEQTLSESEINQLWEEYIGGTQNSTIYRLISGRKLAT